MQDMRGAKRATAVPQEAPRGEVEVSVRERGDVGYLHWLDWYMQREKTVAGGEGFLLQSSSRPDFDFEEEQRDGWSLEDLQVSTR